MTDVFGQQTPSSESSEYNALVFVIQQMLNKLAGPTLVRVVSCTNNGEVAPPGTVNVQPLVNQMTGNRLPVPHGVIYNVPYFRLQAGATAVIVDPRPGDIGLAVFASRDISAVKASKKQSNPGSFRTWDWSDGLYLGGFLNGTASQYVQTSATGGINVVSPQQITLQAPNISFKATQNIELDAATINGKGTNTITLKSPANDFGTATTIDGKPFLPHEHGGVQTGGSNTGGVA